jgi:L-lactate dehydrogenase (cytochrome)
VLIYCRSPPSLLTLLEIRKHAPEVFSKLEVYIDCGVRRGTDIIKALCLGAKAVGMGRPFLYSLTYGQEGVEHFIESTFFSHKLKRRSLY